ncbi:MAG: beta-ketoacyl-ACP synthase II [Chloroflexota bacterium]|nr:beta-ketoacyl-ACP synthase II [Chloroflexota bacterium]
MSGTETAAAARRDPAQRVVVTGMGAMTPLGCTVAELWAGAASGRSGIGRIAQFDPAGYPTQIAGEVSDFDPKRYMDVKDARRMSRASQFAVAAAREAFADAGLDPATLPDEAGVLLGTGNSSFPDLDAASRQMLEKGGMRISPFAMAAVLPSMSGGQIAIHLGLRGYNSTVSTACAAGTQAIGEAVEVLRRGHAEIVLTGGTEAPVCELGLAGFCVMRALSTRNDEPERASRPFDAGRDGFVAGEGAAVLVLETLERARARGARIYAEILGLGSSSDAFHVTAPPPDAGGATRAMRWALKNAGVTAEQIDYINAHGTATPHNDASETVAVKNVFGERAYRLPVSSTKSMIGHCLGAAGAIEAVVTICALREGLIPPTINYEEPDPRCDLDYAPNVARRAPIRIAMSNSFGFGGQNASLVIARVED